MHLNQIILTILLTFFLGVVADSSEEHVRKIAIIGGGVGGTSCAYFLNELLGPENVNVDLYEAHKIGGRLATVEINGNNFEAGGSIIHPRNQYMKQFVDTLGLKVRKGAFEGKVGLYDGNRFVFVESEWQVVTYFRMFWRYGMDLFRMENYIQKLLGKFENIYSVQSKKRKSFETVRKLLSAMSDDLPEYLTMSVEHAFRSKKDWNSKLIEELVLASIRVNYGQNNLIHQFVGSVSVAGAMDGLWSVEGGNCQVPEKLLEHSGSKLINSIVKTVEFNDTSKTFKVFTDDDSEQYDHVVIAAPLTKDMRLPINFVNFPEDLNVPVPGRYHRTVCTFVSGEINGEYFGYKYSNDVPGSIFVLNENLFFNSISLLKPSTKLSPNIYKVFSEDVLTEKQLKSLFKTVKSTEVIDWLAYPQYSTELRNDSFVLYENLYYVNAVEWAASAMEMSAIGGKNVALMVYNAITGGNPKYTFDTVSSNAKSGVNVEL